VNGLFSLSPLPLNLKSQIVLSLSPHTRLPRRSLAGKQNPKPPPVLSFINFGTGQTYDYD
jgi:hypothetical protein